MGVAVSSDAVFTLYIVRDEGRDEIPIDRLEIEHGREGKRTKRRHLLYSSALPLRYNSRIILSDSSLEISMEKEQWLPIDVQRDKVHILNRLAKEFAIQIWSRGNTFPVLSGQNDVIGGEYLLSEPVLFETLEFLAFMFRTICWLSRCHLYFSHAMRTSPMKERKGRE
jgi:hypothetical protein